MSKVNITIDGVSVKVDQGTTVLEAAKQLGIKIPSLCYLKDVNHPASCRVCMVEVGQKLTTSCTLVAEEGMNIRTNTKRVRDARKTIVELLLSNHKMECLVCSRNQNCELQSLSKELNIKELRFQGSVTKTKTDDSSYSLIRDIEKCILCGRCISTCSQIQSVNAIGFVNRGFETIVSTAFEKPMADSVCVNCGQCILACPVGALQEKENIEDVWRAIANKEKFVVVQTAPAIRVALGEEFGLPIGTRVTGKMVAALKKLGFDMVFDTDFAADLTIMEEGTELIKRLKNNSNLPLMTSCCPGWVKFMEHNYPEHLNHLSTCKSPHEMEGAIIKSYFAKTMNVDPQNIVVVSIMPCVAKKFESSRKELSNNSLMDVDYVLTTRELARMIKEVGIEFNSLKDENFDNPFGEATGAAVLFGTTGGVCEAALRTAYELISGQELERVNFDSVRGIKGIKEARIKLPDGMTINTAIVHGLSNARRIVEQIKNKEKEYHFIEVMACPGGCVNGGGQPIVCPSIRDSINVKEVRAKSIYDEDEALVIRKSHKNPYIQKIYEEYLIEPNSELAHKLLHTNYLERNKY